MDDSVRTFNNQSNEMQGILFHADYTLAKINEDDICSNFKTKYEGVLMDESEDDICSIFQTKYAALLDKSKDDICPNQTCRSFSAQ